MNSFAGKLLVASPKMVDDMFGNTVIFVVQDTPDEGTFGVVLNRPATPEARLAWSSEIGVDSDFECRLWVGGPMSGPVIAMHNMEEFADVTLYEDLFVTASKEVLNKVVAQQDSPYRVFFGVSGWAPGQLDNEIDRGDWMIADATREIVLIPNDNLWADTVRELGRDFYKRILGTDNIPDDPRLN